jgi:hypothetical protein
MATGCRGTAKPQLAKSAGSFCRMGRHMKSNQAERKRGKLQQQSFRVHL